MRNRMLVSLVLIGALVPEVATGTPPGGTNPTPPQTVAAVDVNQLYARAASAEAERNAAMATLAQYKASVIAERNKELTDPNSEALRSPSAWKALAHLDANGQRVEALTGNDQLSFTFSTANGSTIDASTQNTLTTQLQQEIDGLGRALNSCVANGWPVVTTSFTIQGGRVTVAPEVSELAPLDASTARMANCLLAGINSHKWTNYGDVSVAVIWRNVGGP